MDDDKGTERNKRKDRAHDLEREREQRGPRREVRPERGTTGLTEEEKRRHLFQEDEPRSAQEERDRFEQDYEV